MRAVRRGRHAHLHRPAARHAPLVRDQAPHQGPVRAAGGLAGEQSAVEQHDRRLQGDLGLPSHPDAEVPAACRRCGGGETRSPPDVARSDNGVPRCGEAGVFVGRNIAVCPARGAPRSGAPQMRDPGCFTSLERNRGPGSASQHCMLRRARDTRFALCPPSIATARIGTYPGLALFPLIIHGATP